MTVRGHRERGTTLIELVVAVGVVAIAAVACFEGLAQRPAQARSTAAAFAGLVREARALAAVSGDPVGGGTGATIAVVREGDQYIATLYTYRPILGAVTVPVAAPNSAPLRTSTSLAIEHDGALAGPPFAVFFSSSGHASAQTAFTIGLTPPLAAEPACPLHSGILIAFIDGVHNQAHAISCEMAQLDLDTAYPIPR